MSRGGPEGDDRLGAALPERPADVSPVKRGVAGRAGNHARQPARWAACLAWEATGFPSGLGLLGVDASHYLAAFTAWVWATFGMDKRRLKEVDEIRMRAGVTVVRPRHPDKPRRKRDRQGAAQ